MKALMRSLKTYNWNITQISKLRTSVILYKTEKMENFQDNPYLARYKEKLEHAKQ